MRHRVRFLLAVVAAAAVVAGSCTKDTQTDGGSKDDGAPVDENMVNDGGGENDEAPVEETIATDGGSEDTDSMHDEGLEFDGEVTPCALDGVWGANFEGTDWGTVNVRFEQANGTYTASGSGYDSDEGPFTIMLQGTVSGSNFGGPYTADYHWEPSEFDYLGEVEGNCFGDTLVGQWRSCNDETVVDGECPTWMWGGKFVAERVSDGNTIQTEGCVAAVNALCGFAAACTQQFPSVPDVDEAVCDSALEARSDKIEENCMQFLTSGVESGSPLAMFLNTATTEDIQECVSGQTCDLSKIRSVVAAYEQYLSDENTEALQELLLTIVEGCYK